LWLNWFIWQRILPAQLARGNIQGMTVLA
jgi:hypothetical protein